mmetsp:Transcript_98070/g.282905  ORF Transcript_98070/g.282905 Transcript_98070/m.282905 type:complete len:231 (+) Transcript_98070:44-736(+)
MAKLAAALREAAALAAQDDAAFGAGVSALLTRVKRGVTEVRKAPELLEKEVRADEASWSFLLRVASEKPAFAKQVWETASVLLDASDWVVAFKAMDQKQRLNLAKAGSREYALVKSIVQRLLAAGAADLDELFPVAICEDVDPALCAELLDLLSSADLSDEVADTAAASEAGRALEVRAQLVEEMKGREKRRVIGGGGQQQFGKGDDIPVYVCEGIHGSHQQMDIKKGLV